MRSMLLRRRIPGYWTATRPFHPRTASKGSFQHLSAGSRISHSSLDSSTQREILLCHRQAGQPMSQTAIRHSTAPKGRCRRLLRSSRTYCQQQLLSVLQNVPHSPRDRYLPVLFDSLPIAQAPLSVQGEHMCTGRLGPFGVRVFDGLLCASPLVSGRKDRVVICMLSCCSSEGL